MAALTVVHPDWFEHPTVKLAYARSDGSPAGVIEQLIEALEKADRLADEIASRGGTLQEVLDRVERIDYAPQSPEALGELRELLKLGLTQTQLEVLFGRNSRSQISLAAHSMPKELPPEQQVVDLYLAGNSVRNVARTLKAREDYVRKVVENYELPRHSTAPKRKPEVPDMVFTMADAGASAAEIGRAVGKSAVTVTRWLNRAGYRAEVTYLGSSGSGVRWVKSR